MSELTPVLSRRTVAPAMAARGLRSASELAAGKPCGTRVRYYAGCRCAACRRANTDYVLARAAARARGEGNGIVSAQRARENLVWLSSRGVGRKTAADAAKVAASTISKIIDGQRLKIRAQTVRRILAVTEATAADGARRPAHTAWRMLDELIAAGYAKSRLASEIHGCKAASLQVGRLYVTVRTEARIRRIYERLRLADVATLALALAQLRELRDEHYRLATIQRYVDELAAAHWWPAPSIDPRPAGGRWPGPSGLTHRACVLIGELHAELIGSADQ